MSEHKNIAAALAAAQAEMEGAKKSANNPHFRSKYADLGSVMDACLPAMNRHGIALIQPIGNDDGAAYVETRLVHGDSDTEVSCRVPLIIGKNDMQGFGSAVTYARRYGLMAMAGIAPEDDDGNAAAASVKGNPPQQAAPQQPRGPSKEAIATACDSLANASTWDQLRAIWGDLPKAVKEAQAVIAAKDAGKAALQARAETDQPITDDEIPHQGN